MDEKQKQIDEWEQQAGEENFWVDTQTAGALMQRLEALRSFVNFWQNVQSDLAGLKGLMEEAGEDEALLAELNQEAANLEEKINAHEFEILLSGKYDSADAIVTLRSGAGGQDAQDWTEMLLRMYLRWAEKQHLKTEIWQDSRGEVGIKSVTLVVRGAYAYGYLKNEAGVHRLVRLSPFNADNLRQTSFAAVEVLPEIPKRGEIEIAAEELRIDTFRSSGAGGQHVNTTDSAVRITHLPTGMVVSCQNERSQLQNREQAMTILRAKLYAAQREAENQERKKLGGEPQAAAWGNQIRSYVLHPYKMVKDHRTELENSNPEKVLDGEIQDFILTELKRENKMPTSSC